MEIVFWVLLVLSFPLAHSWHAPLLPFAVVALAACGRVLWDM